LGAGVAAGSSPSAFQGSDGTDYVFFNGSDGVLHLDDFQGGAWHANDLGAGVAAGSSPSGY
jgi:hypothetical protein